MQERDGRGMLVGEPGNDEGGGFLTNGDLGVHQAPGGSSFQNGGDGGSSTNGSGRPHGGFGGGGAGSWSNGYGGGGGGYSGGGGGSYSGSSGNGGGGGSYNNGVNQVGVAGANSGAGQVTISLAN